LLRLQCSFGRSIIVVYNSRFDWQLSSRSLINAVNTYAQFSFCWLVINDTIVVILSGHASRPDDVI